MFEILTRFVREIAEIRDETLAISFSILVLVTIGLIAYWIYNRRKFHELKHQIPASVLKNYLDSIIQNSTSLKSSLFRGGGLEIGEGIPSVVPVGDLPMTSVGEGGASQEELNQKNAEIASLRQTIADKEALIKELEAKLANAEGSEGSAEEAGILRAEVEKLRGELEEAQAQVVAGGGGGDEALTAQLNDVTVERDELQERLREYEIIEEDLANLKRLQQENDELKKTIQSLQGGGATPEPLPEAAAPAPGPEPEPEPEPGPETEPEPVSEIPDTVSESDVDLEAEMAAAIGGGDEPSPAEEESVAAAGDIPENEGEQKSAEELLSEFEKMLG